MSKSFALKIAGWILCVAALWSTLAYSQAVPESPYYSRANTFGLFAAYSNDSSHILLGLAENRKLLNFGASYGRRVFQNRIVNWQYNAEILPVALESDPVDREVITITPNPYPGFSFTETYRPPLACHNNSGSYTETIQGTVFTYNYVNHCSRQWTMGEGISPVGFQWNFRPRHKLQPFLIGHGGYMYSTQAIPVEGAGSFNFTFDVGAGVELFQSKSSRFLQSVRAEYRYHHISNHFTASENPGIDNGVVQLTYAFGR